MKSSDVFLFRFLHVITWIVFVGLLIETGFSLVVYIYSCFASIDDNRLYPDVTEFVKLYNFDFVHYTIFMILLIASGVLKSLVAYLVIKMFGKINMSNPFEAGISNIIQQISLMLLLTGLLAIPAQWHTESLKHFGVDVNFDWSDGPWLFSAGIVYIIAKIFQRGVEIQSENELTI